MIKTFVRWHEKILWGMGWCKGAWAKFFGNVVALQFFEQWYSTNIWVGCHTFLGGKGVNCLGDI